jgi:hypothetical protein
MKRIKVRFNLRRGKNYMKWKIEYPSGEVEYCSPTDTQLIMKTCQLKNNRKTADKIFNGEHKSVCAWVLCEGITVRYSGFEQFDEMDFERLKYNPKKLPYWVLDNGYRAPICVDGCKYEEMATVDFQLFITKN